MATSLTHKPSHNEWLKIAQITADRLTLCAQVYIQTPDEDAKLTDHERQIKNANVIDILRRIYKLLDETDTPTNSLAEVAHHDEQVIAGLAVLARDTLDQLPGISRDMQKLLGTHWHDEFKTPQAWQLFYGTAPGGAEGIGSGLPEHGRFPAVLVQLLGKEQSGTRRQPRVALERVNIAHPKDESRRRWADLNSQFMRRAGQVE